MGDNTSNATFYNNAISFYSHQFPADGVWQAYTPLPSDSEEDKTAAYLVGHGVGHTASPLATNRIWTIGEQSHRVALSSAKHFQSQLVRNCVRAATNAHSQGTCSVRYDVGPVLHQPATLFLADYKNAKETVGSLKEQYIAFSELRFDIDICTKDYPLHRTRCGCGDTKYKFCDQCAVLLSAVAGYVDVYLSAMGVEARQWVFTGGRGAHCWCRTPNFLGRIPSSKRSHILRRLMHEINLAPLEARSILQNAESRLGNIPITPVLDAGVTEGVGHLMRGISSIHDDTRRVAVLIPNPSALTSRNISPLVADVVADPLNTAWCTSLRVLADYNNSF